MLWLKYKYVLFVCVSFWDMYILHITLCMHTPTSCNSLLRNVTHIIVMKL